MQEQEREQSPLLRAAKRKRAPFCDHLERPEDPEVHGRSRR
jgi:hypothetical protein